MRGVHWNDLPADVLAILRRGAVIPAHPLALDETAPIRPRLAARALALLHRCRRRRARGRRARHAVPDPRSRPLPAGAGAGGRDRASWTERPLVMIAGVIGRTAQASSEARIARALGYHAVLLGLGAMKGASEDELIEHCSAVAGEMPLIGFYLQPAVGGIRLSRALLDALCRDRQRGRHQGGAVQPLRHARRRLRRRRRRRRGARHALHRQRRSHRRRPGDAAARPHAGRPRGDPALQGRAARPLERVDEVGRRLAGQAAGLRRHRRRYRRTSWPSTARSPTATA